MQPKDPYANQREKKSDNRQKILRQIETEPSTYAEIKAKVGLSPPVLINHLRELEKKGLIARQVKGSRAAFVLSDKGKKQEQMRRETIAKAFGVIGKLARDHSSAKSILEIVEFAKAEPKAFDEFMQWSNDFMALARSEDTLQWLKRHRDSGGRLLQGEIMKKLQPHLKAIESESGDDLELNSLYQNVLNATREIVSEKRKTVNESA